MQLSNGIHGTIIDGKRHSANDTTHNTTFTVSDWTERGGVVAVVARYSHGAVRGDRRRWLFWLVVAAVQDERGGRTRFDDEVTTCCRPSSLRRCKRRLAAVIILSLLRPTKSLYGVPHDGLSRGAIYEFVMVIFLFFVDFYC